MTKLLCTEDRVLEGKPTIIFLFTASLFAKLTRPIFEISTSSTDYSYYLKIYSTYIIKENLTNQGISFDRIFSELI